jgi:hypothetical protein
MFVILIIFVPLFILIGVDIYYNLGAEMNGRLWARLLLLLLMEMFFLYGVVYSFKQLINPTLLITVTETGIIVVQNKTNIEIGWGDIESYMICGRPSPGGIVNFYIFLKVGIASTTIPKELKIEYHFKKNQKKLKAAFDENKIKELPPDYDFVKNIK